VDAAAGILDPAGDLHATAGYRKHVAGVLLRRAVAEAYGNAAGGQITLPPEPDPAHSARR